MTPPLIEMVKQLIGFETVIFQIYPHVVSLPKYVMEGWDPQGVS